MISLNQAHIMFKNFIFYVVTIIFNTILPMINKGLYAVVVKLSLAMTVHFLTVSVTSWFSTKCSLHNPSLETQTDKNLIVQGQGYMMNEACCPDKLN